MTLTLDAIESPWAKQRTRWLAVARWDQQLPPLDEDFDVFLFLGGRGSGKTRSGAEDQSEYARTHPGSRIALVAPTFADVRDTMVEGESGLLSVLPPSALTNGSREDSWNRSMGELHLSNGVTMKGFSSEKPDRLRGPQHHRAWVDEPAAFKDAHRGDVLDTTWNNLMLGLRLGERPQAFVSGTPKRVRLVKELLARPRVKIVRASTYDNLANLAPTFRDTILSQYEGTRIGRQELLAELLDDVEGALWSQAMLDDHRRTTSPDFSRVTTAIDPAVTSGEDSDETGMIVAGRGIDGDCYILADRSCRLSPDAWARRAVGAHDEYEGDRIVGEANNGGDLVETVLRAVDPAVPYVKVNASRGKRVRAEPVAALYEQGRVHHVGSFPELEEQMVSWTPDSGESPDRLDALVWAVTDLMLGEERRRMKYRGAA